MKKVKRVRKELKNTFAELTSSVNKEPSIIEEFETQLTSNEPNRELVSGKNIKFKTQITEEQRGAISILLHAYKLCLKYGINFDGLKYVLDEFIDFGASVDRKSRNEFVDAQKAQMLQQQLQNQQHNNQVQNLKM
jgi:hypothetical protein